LLFVEKALIVKGAGAAGDQNQKTTREVARSLQQQQQQQAKMSFTRSPTPGKELYFIARDACRTGAHG